MEKRITDTYQVQIFIAGNYEAAKELCRKYCWSNRYCLSLTPIDYIYHGGEESGVQVTLINYPRFPETPECLYERASLLADYLMNGLYQTSYTIQAPDKTVWFSRRKE